VSDDLRSRLDREAGRLADCIVGRLAAFFCTEMGHSYDQVAYEVCGDDGCTVLRRASDGQVFTVGLTAEVRPVLTDSQIETIAAQREARLLELAGQQRLPEASADA
jgi:hypothetical protein